MTVKEACLKLLNKFIEVCDAHNLNWFIDSGTLLGCVRKGKMIPWDDDIDIIMPRKDYDLLHKYADEFESPFFFQTAETDKYFEIHAKLRLDGTACITKRDKDGLHHQGMALDIFVLDSVPDDQNEFEAEIGFLRMIGRYSSMHNICEKEYLKHQAMDEALIYQAMNEVVADATNRNSNSKYVGNVMFCRYSDYKDVKFSREAYSSYFVKMFENIPVRVPIGYEEILEGWYGKDWRIEKQAPTFHSALIDANRDYRQISLLEIEKFFE